MKLLIRRITPIIAVIICTLILPGLGYAQPNPGGNPDNNPPAVPIDHRMDILLITAGALFSIVILKKFKKKSLTQKI